MTFRQKKGKRVTESTDWGGKSLKGKRNRITSKKWPKTQGDNFVKKGRGEKKAKKKILFSGSLLVNQSSSDFVLSCRAPRRSGFP